MLGNLSWYLIFPKNIWHYVTISDSILQYLTVSNNIWWYPVIYNIIRQYLTISRNIWQYQTISILVNVRQYHTISNNIQQYKKIFYYIDQRKIIARVICKNVLFQNFFLILFFLPERVLEELSLLKIIQPPPFLMFLTPSPLHLVYLLKHFEWLVCYYSAILSIMVDLRHLKSDFYAIKRKNWIRR